MDPQDLLGSFLLADIDLIILGLLAGTLVLDFLGFLNVTTGLGASVSRAVGFLRGTSVVVVILVKGHVFPTIVKVRPVDIDLIILGLLAGTLVLDFLGFLNVTTGLGASVSRAVGFLRGTSVVVVILVKGHVFPTIVKVRPVGYDLLALVDGFTLVEDIIGLLETRFDEEAVFMVVFPKDVTGPVNLTLFSLFFGVTTINFSLELLMLGKCRRPVTVKKAEKRRNTDSRDQYWQILKVVLIQEQRQGVIWKFIQSSTIRAISAYCSKLLRTRTGRANIHITFRD
nr:hypothetical protein [Tanacetum cinerariifolium]